MTKLHSLKANPRFFKQSLRYNGWDLRYALSELIDNSIDAGADTVTILQDGKPGNWNFIVKDNGEGMSPELLSKALELSSPDLEYGDSDIGNFGVGLKAAIFAITHHGSVTIETISEGTKSLVTVDVDEVGHTDIVSTPSSEPSGTVIILPNHTKRVDDALITKYLGVTYHPAFSNNRKFKIIYDKVGCKNCNTITFTDPFYRDLKPSEQEGIERIYRDFKINGESLTLKGILLSKDFTKVNSYDMRAGKPEFTASRGGIYIKLLNRYISLGDNYFPAIGIQPGYNRYRIELEVTDKDLQQLFVNINKNTVKVDTSDDVFKSFIESFKSLINELVSKYQSRPSDKVTEATQEMLDKIAKKLARLVQKFSHKSKVGIKQNNNDETPEDQGGSKNRPSGLKYIKNLFNFHITGVDMEDDLYFNYLALKDGKLLYNNNHPVGQYINSLQDDHLVAETLLTDIVITALSLMEEQDKSEDFTIDNVLSFLETKSFLLKETYKVQ